MKSPGVSATVMKLCRENIITRQGIYSHNRYNKYTLFGRNQMISQLIILFAQLVTIMVHLVFTIYSLILFN